MAVVCQNRRFDPMVCHIISKWIWCFHRLCDVEFPRPPLQVQKTWVRRDFKDQYLLEILRSCELENEFVHVLLGVVSLWCHPSSLIWHSAFYFAPPALFIEMGLSAPWLRFPSVDFAYRVLDERFLCSTAFALCFSQLLSFFFTLALLLAAACGFVLPTAAAGFRNMISVVT